MMRNLSLLPALLLAHAVLLSHVARADVYCKREGQGQMQCSDRPMPGAERVVTGASKIPGANAAATAAEAERLKTVQGQMQTQQAKEATQQTVQQDVATVRAEQCQKAQTNYDKAIRARRLTRTNANGEREFLSDAAADAARLEAKAVVDEACGKK
jgi:phage protein D